MLDVFFGPNLKINWTISKYSDTFLTKLGGKMEESKEFISLENWFESKKDTLYDIKFSGDHIETGKSVKAADLLDIFEKAINGGYKKAAVPEKFIVPRE